MENFQKIKIIGKGTYSEVYKVRDKRDNKLYALKISSNKPNTLPNVLNDVMVMSQSEHESVAQSHEVIFEKNKIIMKMDLGYLDLGVMMERYKNFGPGNAVVCIDNILKGLEYLHDMGIAHCDLKPENIIFYDEKDNSHLEITDFNSAQFLSSTGKTIHNTPGCTRWYRSPESLLECRYDEKSDIWAVGCILYELLTGKVLFNGDNENEQMTIILEQLGIPDDYPLCIEWIVKSKTKVKTTPNDFNEISDKSALDLLKLLLVINPEKRITASKALKHPYLA